MPLLPHKHHSALKIRQLPIHIFKIFLLGFSAPINLWSEIYPWSRTQHWFCSKYTARMPDPKGQQHCFPRRRTHPKKRKVRQWRAQPITVIWTCGWGRQRAQRHDCRNSILTSYLQVVQISICCETIPHCWFITAATTWSHLHLSLTTGSVCSVLCFAKRLKTTVNWGKPFKEKPWSFNNLSWETTERELVEKVGSASERGQGKWKGEQGLATSEWLLHN